MKKIAALTFALFAVASAVYADEFTEMIHVLAVKAASLGTYDATRVNVDFEIGNDYSPQIWAERFAAEYGSIAGERTFLGVCANYTVFSYNEINANTRKYNAAGMNGDQFFMASADISTQIELLKTTTREGATTYKDGRYVVRLYGSDNVPIKSHGIKNILTHKHSDGRRASNHAWIWIQRDDGVWFWVDPTWTDNLGWVVWGYIKNGEEVQLKPDKKFCVDWRSRLDEMPDPPPRGPKIQPAYVAQTQKPRPAAQQPSSSSASSSRPSSSRQNTSPSYTRSSYSHLYGYNHGISVGVSKPLIDFTSGNYIGNSFWDTIGGVSVSYEDGNSPSIIGLFQLDYYNLDTKSILLDFGIGKQFGKVFALYAGAGLGGGTTAGSVFDISLDNLRFMWKAFAGVRLTFGRIALRADVSYLRDSGVILGAYAGWMF